MFGRSRGKSVSKGLKLKCHSYDNMQIIPMQPMWQTDKTIEKLCFELEQEEKYSWGNPFNLIFIIDWCTTLTNVSRNQIRKKRQCNLQLWSLWLIIAKSFGEFIPWIYVRSFCWTIAGVFERVIASYNKWYFVDTLEKCLQQSSLSSNSKTVCEEVMLVSVQEPLHDPSHESLQVLPKKMSFEPIKEHVQPPL